jgi:uncharacterized protein GlcG (DUF336 family)
MPYGPTIDGERARRAAEAAVAEARLNGWQMAIAIVDPGGFLVFFEKMDDTQVGSVRVAIDKARSAALFKRPTKAFQDALAGPAGVKILSLRHAIASEGGLPLVSDGRIIGAIGVSGGTSEQDGHCAAAAARAV